MKKDGALSVQHINGHSLLCLLRSTQSGAITTIRSIIGGYFCVYVDSMIGLTLPIVRWKIE